MIDPLPAIRPTELRVVGGEQDLQTVVEAWHDATSQLEQTQESLRAEVRRLRDELQDTQQLLATQSRLAELGRTSADLAERLHNELAPLAYYASLLRRRVLGDPSSIDLVRKLDAGLASLDTTLGDLADFAAQRTPRLVPVAVRELVEEIQAGLMAQLATQRVSTVIDVPERLVVVGDREMLRRAILNLTQNALDAMPQGGELVITSFAGKRGVELEIADSGTGLSPDGLARAFQPFYSTKSSTGLGLAIVERIAQAHGGDVCVCNCPEGGAAFTLRFPRRVLEAAA